MNIHMHIMT